MHALLVLERSLATRFLPQAWGGCSGQPGVLAPYLVPVLLWALPPCVWRIHQQRKAGTFWRPTGIFARGHGAGSVDRQCNSSDVSSGAISGSSPSFGRYCVVAAALPLLRCVWILAAVLIG